MHTIPAPPDPWGPRTPGKRYGPTRPHGKRIAGWEDTNVTLLAADMQVSFRYLKDVLTGGRNCTLALLQSAAKTLGIELSELAARMKRSFQLKSIELATLPTKSERRRVRSVKRALQPRE